jgi:Arc/MetJ-type ribon-helix-helix transcriptional regulator
MSYIRVKVGEEVTKSIGEAIREHEYSSEEEFIREAIRHELKELKSKKLKEVAWHKLLSAHEGRKMMRKTFSNGKQIIRRIRSPRFSLKDFLRHRHEYEYE